MPAHFDLLLDPDYEFTNSYGLRWDAPKETAYPSTFVIDRSGVVRFAKVSQTHGGRASVAEILEALQTIR
jgi:peroxiredoxin Q/BCP